MPFFKPVQFCSKLLRGRYWTGSFKRLITTIIKGNLQMSFHFEFFHPLCVSGATEARSFAGRDLDTACQARKGYSQPSSPKTLSWKSLHNTPKQTVAQKQGICGNAHLFWQFSVKKKKKKADFFDTSCATGWGTEGLRDGTWLAVICRKCLTQCFPHLSDREKHLA